MAVFYQQSKQIARLRNLTDERVTRKKILGAPGLKLAITTPNKVIPWQNFVVEDVNSPSYNADVRTQFRETLPGILLGENKRWKLWEALIFTDRIVLHYTDMENTVTWRSKNTDLSCFTFWKSDMGVWVGDAERKNYYDTEFHMDWNDNYSRLSLKYPSMTSGPGVTPVEAECEEIYLIHIA